MADETLYYRQGSALPDITIFWRDGQGALRDFSVGWTFSGRLGTPTLPAVFEKSSGFAGAAGSESPPVPNLVVSFPAMSELTTAPPGVYVLEITAKRDSDAKPIVKTVPITVLAAVGPAA